MLRSQIVAVHEARDKATREAATLREKLAACTHRAEQAESKSAALERRLQLLAQERS